MSSFTSKCSNHHLLIDELNKRSWSYCFVSKDDDMRKKFSTAQFPIYLMDGHVNRNLYCKYLASMYFVYGFFCGWFGNIDSSSNQDREYENIIAEVLGKEKYELKNAFEQDLEKNFGASWRDSLHDLVLSETLDPYFFRVKNLKPEFKLTHFYVKIFGDALISNRLKEGVSVFAKSIQIFSVDLQHSISSVQRKLDILCSENVNLCDDLVEESNSALDMYIAIFKNLDSLGDLKPKIPYLPPERIASVQKRLGIKVKETDDSGSKLRDEDKSTKKAIVQLTRPPREIFEKIKSHRGIDYETADTSMCPALNPDGTPKEYSKYTMIMLWTMFFVVLILALVVFGYHGTREFLKSWDTDAKSHEL
jgi:hypothetical protein